MPLQKSFAARMRPCRAQEVDPKFLEPEYPFEWIGIYRLSAGTHSLKLGLGPDPTIRIAAMPSNPLEPDFLIAASERAVRSFSNKPKSVSSGASITPNGRAVDLAVNGDSELILMLKDATTVALVTQHRPEEFNARLTVSGETLQPVMQQYFKANHTHDQTVSSVGLSADVPLDVDKLNRWIGTLMQKRGQDIFRLKGVLHLKGDENRWVLQGVHMLMRAQPDRPWKQDEDRHSQLVFIGRKLDRAELNAGFKACLT
jgi:hypothetical protein